MYCSLYVLGLICNILDSLQADKKKTQGSVFITERTTSTVSFSWSDIVSDSNPKLSSVYLLVLQVYNPIYPDLKNVLGLVRLLTNYLEIFLIGLSSFNLTMHYVKRAKLKFE